MDVDDGSCERDGTFKGGGVCVAVMAGGSTLCGDALESCVVGAGITALGPVRDDSCSNAVNVPSVFVNKELAAMPERKMAIADKINEHIRIVTGAAHADTTDWPSAAEVLPMSSGATPTSPPGEFIALPGVVTGNDTRLSERGVTMTGILETMGSCSGPGEEGLKRSAKSARRR